MNMLPPARDFEKWGTAAPQRTFVRPGEIRPIAGGCQVCLIWVKQPGRSGTKLEFSFSRKVPTVPTEPFSEFKALLLSQREQLLREVRERIAVSGDGLGFANQSKITDDDAVADAAAQMDVMFHVCLSTAGIKPTWKR
jgi:hypothetical protein